MTAVKTALLPVSPEEAFAGDGTETTPGDRNGYSVVEAEDLSAARALCEGHPFLSDGTARFSVEIFELAPIEM